MTATEILVNLLVERTIALRDERTQVKRLLAEVADWKYRLYDSHDASHAALKAMTEECDKWKASNDERAKMHWQCHEQLVESQEKLTAMTEERDAIRDKALSGINRMLDVMSAVKR